MPVIGPAPTCGVPNVSLIRLTRFCRMAHDAPVEPILFIGQSSPCSFHSFVAKVQRPAGEGQMCTVLSVLPKHVRLFHRSHPTKNARRNAENGPAWVLEGAKAGPSASRAIHRRASHKLNTHATRFVPVSGIRHFTQTPVRHARQHS